MKIVIADPIFLPEEYKSRLEALGELEVYDSVPSSLDEFVGRIKDAEIVVVGRYGVSAEAFRHAPSLKLISLWQTGYDNIDLEAANKQSVIVSNVPNYAFDSVAEFTFALALNLLRKVQVADMNLRKGKSVDLEILLTESDTVTLHLPLTPNTEHMIGASQLAKMKSTAILINTARGKIIDEEALVETLREKKIAGAGLDVFEKEPLPLDSPLLELDNVVLTPHIAFLSEESIDECTYVCVENIEMFAKGQPQNVVNPRKLAA